MLPKTVLRLCDQPDSFVCRIFIVTWQKKLSKTDDVADPDTEIEAESSLRGFEIIQCESGQQQAVLKRDKLHMRSIWSHLNHKNLCLFLV